MAKAIGLPTLLVYLCLVPGWGAASTPAVALRVAPGASVSELAAAIVREGVAPDRLDGYAAALLAQGVGPGDLAASLLGAGFGTFEVVKGVLVEGVLRYSGQLADDALQLAADDLVREVAARVLYVQGPSVRQAVFNGILAARQALLDLGKLPQDAQGSRFVRGGGELDLLLDQSEVAAAASGASWQSDTAPGGEASAR
jgi:hypothetical protein